ncbi:MAG: hypothetical protein FH756_13590 [Firmicutes bacterium]|nr:hypothetical protein [Bacillota bacterium]
MNIPIDKNKRWIAGLHDSIDQLGEDLQAAIMKPAGKKCASDLFSLCESYLGRKVETIEDLVNGWNTLREKRNLEGKWVFKGDRVRGTFYVCGCPLVRSGMIELHPVQCYCSQGMMEMIFSAVAKKTVQVKIEHSIGRGDDVCQFLIKL